MICVKYKMKYIFTSKPELKVSFIESVFNNLPYPNGLWLPENIPYVKDLLKNIQNMSFVNIAKEILSLYIEDIPKFDLYKIIEDSFTFLPQMEKMDDQNYIYELFHGPTFAFKDFGASFMGNLYEYLSNEKINVITATSGDTGGAVANAFNNKKNIKVFVLYPKNKISKLQEKQITTLGKNIYPIEVNGTFDDCQALVKQTLNDPHLNLKIVSANSINIARLLPQVLYYFYLYKYMLKENINSKIIVSVPSGNLGNLTSGIIAKKMGVPIHKFICSVNVNKTFHNFLTTNIYTPQKSIQTLSSAMDVGNPSNFIRLKYLYDKNNKKKIHDDIISYSFTNYETLLAIQSMKTKYNYLVDPHTAVGICGINKHKETNENFVYVTLSTAHPAKFKSEIETNTNIKVNLPYLLLYVLQKNSHKIQIPNNYSVWIELLLQNQ